MQAMHVRDHAKRQVGTIGGGERFASVAVGATLLVAAAAMLLQGRRGRGAMLAAAGGVLAQRGLRGRSVIYRKLGIEDEDASPSSNPLSRRVHVRCAITINESADELYRRWRNIEQLPEILRHVRRVEQLDAPDRSRWTVRGPLGSDVEWEARITDEDPGNLLAWESVESQLVENQGRVEFVPAPGGRGTILRVHLTYRPVGGAVGAVFARLFGADPASEVQEDLRRFKQVVETGSVMCAASAPEREPSVPRWRAKGDRSAPERRDRDDNVVEEASKMSFPASDPPAW